MRSRRVPRTSSPSTRRRRDTLRRPVDRFENWLRVVVVVCALGAVPLGLVAGSAVHSHDVAVADAATAGDSQVTAVLSQDVPAAAQVEYQRSSVLATARWQPPTGGTRTGLVPTTPGSPAGQRVAIWVDRHGDRVDDPLTADEIYWQGLLTGVGTALTVLALLGAITHTAHRRLDGVRIAAWEADWRRVEPQWTRGRTA